MIPATIFESVRPAINRKQGCRLNKHGLGRQRGLRLWSFPSSLRDTSPLTQHHLRTFRPQLGAITKHILTSTKTQLKPRTSQASRADSFIHPNTIIIKNHAQDNSHHVRKHTRIHPNQSRPSQQQTHKTTRPLTPLKTSLPTRRPLRRPRKTHQPPPTLHFQTQHLTPGNRSQRTGLLGRRRQR